MVYDIYDLFLIYKILYEIHFSDLPLAQQGGLHFFFFMENPNFRRIYTDNMVGRWSVILDEYGDPRLNSECLPILLMLIAKAKNSTFANC